MEPQATSSEQHADSRACWLVRLWGLALAALIGVTWPLWLPATDPPCVPVFSFLGGLPGVVTYVLLACVGWSLLGLLRSREFEGLAYGCFGLAGLMALDQLRWQPWAYHLLILGLVLMLARRELAIRLLRILAVSVYVYSAIAKLDHAFASTLGRQMIDAVLRLVGIDAGTLPPGLLLAAALTMPMAEGVIGPLLLFRRTRTAGLVLATLMHLSAVLALGPLGLNHRPGVLLWNLVFLAHLWLLFGPAPRRATPVERPIGAARGDLLAWAMVLLAVLGPLTRPLGVWDRWPSWGLYAPGGERTEVLVHRSVIERLPDSLPIDEHDQQSNWRRVRLDDWSLNESKAPLYPQRRTTLALALALHERGRLGDFVRVDLYSPADRFTGQRTSESLLGAKAIEQHATRCWLGASAAPSQR